MHRRFRQRHAYHLDCRHAQRARTRRLRGSTHHPVPREVPLSFLCDLRWTSDCCLDRRAAFAYVTLAFGVLITGIDLAVGLPTYWTLFEGPPTFILGGVILLLARRVERSDDSTSQLPSDVRNDPNASIFAEERKSFRLCPASIVQV